MRQPRIKPAASHQFIMRAYIDHLAGLHHHDTVGLEHGRQAVSDDQGGAYRGEIGRASCRERV